MRRSISMLSILLAFLVSLVMGVSTASAKKICTDFIESGDFYVCEGVDEFGVPLEFGLGIDGKSGPHFQSVIVFPNTLVLLDCACRSKGTPGSAQFEVLKSFECVSSDQEGTQVPGTLFNFNGPSAYQGRTSNPGKNIGGFQGVDQEGDSISAKCKRED